MIKSLVKEFVAFLKEFKVVSLAVAFIMGAASTSLINSLVKDVLMPVIDPLMEGETWREAVLTIGSIHITYGSFLAELINFIILALIVFFVAKKIFKMEKEK